MPTATPVRPGTPAAARREASPVEAVVTAPDEPAEGQLEAHPLDRVAWAVWLGGFVLLLFWHFLDVLSAIVRA